MSAKDVKAYVKRNKNDATETEGIARAPTDDAICAGDFGRAARSADAASHRYLLLRQRGPR
jgi:hypothetical protein